jgi:formylglycine-generating enzyme required for sulfatase activity
VTQGGNPVEIGDPVGGGVPDGSWILPDGTIVIPSSPDDGTPKDEDGDGRPEVGPGDIIVLPPYDTPFVVPAPGGEFDPSIPGIVTGEIPPRTILIPSGVIDDGTGIVLPGPDGNFGTEDDVKVSPAGPADVDPGTGIVTVPGGGASVCTNGTDISVGNPVNGTTLPEGTLVLPDGTVIVPSTPPDGTPAVNPDGTVTVGEGDVIFVPPYDRPFVVPAPGGEFDPSIPGIVTGEVPPRTILIPSGVIDDGTGIVLPGPDGNFGTDDDVRVSPAGPADVDPGTGIVTVPGGGASVSTNGTDVSFGDPVNGTTLPEGTLVLPDGTVIVPSTPPDGTPAVNPDGTVTVGEGDVIFVPPYDKPYVVPAPGGTYVPGQPPSVVLDTVPPTTVTLPPETQPGYPKDPAVAWSGVEATIMIDLTNNCLVTTLPADYAVTNDAASKTAHLYLRKIKAGQFMMGMPSTEVFHQPDAAQKLVTLSKAFYVGVYEVTAYQYGRVDTGAVSGGKTPKVSVSWSMLRGGSAAVNAAPAGGWLKKLTDAVAANPANAGLGLTFDLPTEAQWEFAARAGTAGTYSDSDVVETAQAAAETRMGPLGWWSGNSGAALHEVGLKAANHAGLYDVHGNASEWCRDAWDSSLALPGGTDPLGLTGTNRALRGGGYSSPAVVCRSAARASTVPGGAGGVALGFRLSASAVSP